MQINQARNDDELKKMLLIPLKEAVKILMKKILDQNYDSILRVVYNAPGRPLYPNCYESTTEFLDAWDVAVHSAKHIGHDIQGDFFYKPSGMETSSPPNEDNNFMGQHHGIGANITGSMDSPHFGEFYGDSREYLADIIYQGLAGPIYGDGYWRRKRDAFNDLVKTVGKRNFNKWMVEAMEEVGLKVQSHGGIVRRDEK